MSKLDNALNEYSVVVVSKTYCPYCVRAKNLLNGYDLKSYKVLECDSEPEIQTRAMEITGQRTVPNIFIGGKSVGGCDAVTALDRSGKLKGMLEEAGAL